MTNIPCPPPDLNPSDQYHFSIFTKYEMLRKDRFLLQWKKKQVFRNKILSAGNFKLQVEYIQRGKYRSSYTTYNCDSDHIFIDFFFHFCLALIILAIYSASRYFCRWGFSKLKFICLAVTIMCGHPLFRTFKQFCTTFQYYQC